MDVWPLDPAAGAVIGRPLRSFLGSEVLLSIPSLFFSKNCF